MYGELKTMTVKTSYNNEAYEFEIRELTGIEVDEITEKALIIEEYDGENKTRVSIKVLNKERMLLSVVSATCDGKPFDFAQQTKKHPLPNKLHMFLVKSIDKLNKIDEEFAKNLSGPATETQAQAH